MEAGGLDREAAEGELPRGVRSDAKISYIVGEWQIMTWLGRYRDKQDATSSGTISRRPDQERQSARIDHR